MKRRTKKELWPMIWLCAAGGMAYFTAACLAASDTIKGMVIAATVVAIPCCIFSRRLRERFSLPLLMFALMVLMGGISITYANSSKFAMEEFVKLLLSLLMVIVVLSAVRGEGMEPRRRVAAILATATALFGLASVDAFSTNIVSSVLMAVPRIFSEKYSTLPGVENGIRMVSIFNTPNAFACCEALGVLLSLGLADEARDKNERRIFTALLAVNALSFLLAFSMGASAAIAAAFIVLIFFTPAPGRAGLFALMLETLVPVGAATAVIAATSFSGGEGFNLIPLLALVASAAALVFLDEKAAKPLTALFSRGKNTVPALIGGAAVLVVVYALAAWNITSPATLRGETLRRSVYPAEGSYTLRVEADGAVNVRVIGQDLLDTMMHTEKTLYEGKADGANIAVPEDCRVVYCEFSADGEVKISSAVLEGAGGSYSVPLNYPLLPGFVANRLQGLFANQNAIQRFVFFEDGLKLFFRSPIYGLGLGAYENGVQSVQTFYYETKYAHNHYIQCLAETGIIGLSLFLGLLGVSLWKVRKREDTLSPALMAALVFLILHAAWEVDFSFFACLPIICGVFAVCGIGGEPFLGEKPRRGILCGVAAMALLSSVLLGLGMQARSMAKSDLSFDTLEKAAKMDVFEWADYELTYVYKASSSDSAEIRRKADGYAEHLATLNSNSVPPVLAEYYFLTGRGEMGVKMLEKYVSYVISNPATWQKTFALLKQYYEPTAEMRAGLDRIVAILDKWNAENPGRIELDSATLSWIAEMRSA